MSQASVGGLKRLRQCNFTSSEVSLLTDEVTEHSRILFAPFSSNVTNQMKLKKWNEIAAKLSACSSAPRTGVQVRKKWNDYRSQVRKKKIDVSTESSKTGGGAPPQPLSELENKVAALIPSCQIEGILGGLDTEDFIQSSVVNCTQHSSSGVDAADSDNALPEASKTEEISQTVQNLSYTPQDNKPVIVCRQQKRKVPAARKVYQPPAHVTSMVDIETVKMNALKEILDIQKELLKLKQQDVAINRERLDFEKEMWEVKKYFYQNTESNSHLLTLSPVIKF